MSENKNKLNEEDKKVKMRETSSQKKEGLLEQLIKLNEESVDNTIKLKKLEIKLVEKEEEIEMLRQKLIETDDQLKKEINERKEERKEWQNLLDGVRKELEKEKNDRNEERKEWKSVLDEVRMELKKERDEREEEKKLWQCLSNKVMEELDKEKDERKNERKQLQIQPDKKTKKKEEYLIRCDLTNNKDEIVLKIGDYSVKFKINKWVILGGVCFAIATIIFLSPVILANIKALLVDVSIEQITSVVLRAITNIVNNNYSSYVAAVAY